MDSVRWGVVSTGSIAHKFVQDMVHVANGEVVAVGSRASATAEAFASTYGIRRAHGSYAALFSDETVDAVYVGDSAQCPLEQRA